MRTKSLSYQPLGAALLFLGTTLLPDVRAQLLFDDLERSRLPLGNASYASVVADFDGDGDSDIAVAGGLFGGLRMRMLLNNGLGTFQSSPSHVASMGFLLPGGLAAGDFDADGDVDLVIVHRASLPNRIYFNDGGGFFDQARSTVIGTGGDGRDAVVFDADGDGDLDVAVANTTPGSVMLWRNRSGTVFDGELITAGGNSWSLAAGDIDGDGDLDLAIGNGRFAPQNQLMVNDGAGNFTDATANLPTDNVITQDLAFVDVDQDGDLDLALANSSPWRNLLYINDGSGTFAATFTGPVNGDSRSVSVADLDADGDADLVFGGNGRVLTYINDGAGVYTNDTSLVPGDAFSNALATLADFDADNDFDLVVLDGLTPLSKLYQGLRRQLHAPSTSPVGATIAIDAYRSPPPSATEPVAVLLGLPGSPLAVGNLGVFWLIPGSFAPLATISLSPMTGTGTLAVAIPNDPTLSGFTFGLQGVFLDSAGQPTLTNGVFTRLQ